MGTDHVYRLGSRALRSEELSAFVLRSLKEDVERHLGQPVTEAVVTVPAYFGELQRRATHNACVIAGLHVERIINEPTAAALAFGLHALDRELKAVVLDKGGGTFDVTALEILEGVIEIQSSAGDARLGGEDFTHALADHLAGRIAAQFGAAPSPGSGRARVVRAAELVRREPAGDNHSVIIIRGHVRNTRFGNSRIAHLARVYIPSLRPYKMRRRPFFFAPEVRIPHFQLLILLFNQHRHSFVGKTHTDKYTRNITFWVEEVLSCLPDELQIAQ
jgi:hypothetical protein